MSVQGILLASAYSVGVAQDIVSFTAVKKATWTYYLDIAAMSSGDIITVSVYSQVIDGGAEQIFSTGLVDFDTILANDFVVSSFPIVVEEGQSYRLEFTMTAGTPVDVPFAVSDVPIS
jgi:hypothetical protein